MAEPQREVPTEATNRPPERPADGEAAIRAALAEHGGPYADAIEHTDELADVLDTAIVVLANADDEDVEYVTESIVSLVNAADGLSTAGTVALAESVGENGDDLAAAIDQLVRLQRDGHLESAVTMAESVAGSLSAEQAERLSTAVDENADDFVDALDAVLDLQRDGQLESLVETAETLSALDLNEEAVAGMNRFFAAMGEAERTAEPAGLLETLRAMGGADARAGLGYLIALLRSQGRRLRRGE